MNESSPRNTIQELTMNLRILVGSSSQSAQAALRFGSGSAVALERDPRGQVSILVGDRLLAHGDLVLNDGRLAIKVTAIVEAHQRN